MEILMWINVGLMATAVAYGLRCLFCQGCQCLYDTDGK